MFGRLTIFDRFTCHSNYVFEMAFDCQQLESVLIADHQPFWKLDVFNSLFRPVSALAGDLITSPLTERATYIPLKRLLMDFS